MLHCYLNEFIETILNKIAVVQCKLIANDVLVYLITLAHLLLAGHDCKSLDRWKFSYKELWLDKGY